MTLAQKTLALLIPVCLASFFTFEGQAKSPDSKQNTSQIKLDLPVTRYKLKNGLTVLLLEDHSTPLISYHTWYKVGSADEWKGVTGAAHMLEHMMFQGSKNYTGEQFAEILAESGVSYNAFTSTDFTGFYQNLPNNMLETVMKLEIDRMSSVLIKQESLDQELQVVKEERRMSYENSPDGRRYLETAMDAFAGTSYGIPTIGTMEDISKYTSQKLRFFWEKYYKPNNAVLALVGDFKTEEAKALIEKYYGKLKPGVIPKRPHQELDMKRPGKVHETKWDFNAKMMSIHFPAVSIRHPDYPALSLLAAVLGAGESSRMPWKFTEEDQTALKVYVGLMDHKNMGAFNISFTLKPDTDSKKILEQTKSMIQEIQQKPPTEEEMLRAKNRMNRDLVEEMLKLGDRAQILAAYEILHGDYRAVFREFEAIQKVTAQEVTQVAKKYLSEKQLSVLFFEKDGAQK